MKRVAYICSPYRGLDVKKNVEMAKKYCKFVSLIGLIPFCPHLYFTQFLDDNVPEERELAFSMNYDFLKHCDFLCIFGDKITEGMKSEIDKAIEYDVPVLYFDKIIQEVVKFCSAEGMKQ